MRTQKAAFLDRDGIINKLVNRDGGWYSPQSVTDFKLEDGIHSFVSSLKEIGFKVLVVTNQPDVSRGTLSPTCLGEMNSILREELDLLDIFVCQHDPSERCRCRKPQPGLILEAARIYSLDLESSFLLGDRVSDALAAERARVMPIIKFSCQTEFEELHRFKFVCVSTFGQALDVVRSTLASA